MKTEKTKAIYSQPMITPIARVSYPHLVEPSVGLDGQTRRYQLDLIFEEGADLAELQKAIKEIALQAFGNVSPATLLLPLKNGDDKKDALYKGRKYITPKSKDIVKCYDAARRTIDATEIYGGCYARAQISLGTFNLGNRGVTCYLNAVQFVRDGEKLSKGLIADPMAFGDLPASGNTQVGWDDDTIPF